MLNFEYLQFLLEKIREHMPPTFKNVGGKYNGRCPFCGDSHKSASKKRGWIYFSTDCSYFCFNCGIHMSGIKLLEAISGEEASNIKHEYMRLFLKNSLKSSLSSESNIVSNCSLFLLSSIVKPEWKKPLSVKAKTYLELRKVLEAPFLSDPLYSCNGKNGDEFILIPWKVNNVDAYYQLNDFLMLHGIKYVFPKSQKKLIAGLDNIDLSWPYVIVFEGYYDSLFVKNGIAVGTKAITDYQLKMIRERYPRHQIVISFDNDIAGIQSMCKLIKKNVDFKYFKWFNKNTQLKDINDYVLYKNNVNMFADPKVLEKLIIDKLLMKLFLILNGYWKLSENSINIANRESYDTNTFWKTRKI